MSNETDKGKPEDKSAKPDVNVAKTEAKADKTEKKPKAAEKPLANHSNAFGRVHANTRRAIAGVASARSGKIKK